MFAGPRKVGKRLCLIAAALALAITGAAVEPAHIGPIKYLRDGKVDKICFDYQGTLRYREFPFARAQYGYFLFEPAVLQDPKFRLKPQGVYLKDVEARPLTEGDRQCVRVLYYLNRWTPPSIRDTGSHLEITFAPPEAAGAGDQIVPPAQQAVSDKGVAPPATLSATSFTQFLAGNPQDPAFAEYLKLDATEQIRRDPAFAATTPKPPEPQPKTLAAPAREVADALNLRGDDPRPTFDATRAAPEPSRSALSAAQGGEGVPPAQQPPPPEFRKTFDTPKATAPPAAPVSTAAGAAPSTKPAGAKYDVLRTTKPFVPEAGGGLLGPGKITGGRGFEFVDLSEEQFQKRVSMTFKDADLQNAIRVLSRQAELNVVMDPSQIKGRVTVELNNVAVGPALASILRTNDLELIREAGGIYRVVPSRLVRRSTGREEITVHVPLNWVTAEDVQKILTPIVEGRITADPIGNSVILTDTPLKIEEIANVISRIDKPEKQVMLEARLVEMNTDLSRSLGISWDMSRVDRDISKQALGLPIQSVLGTRPGIPQVIGFDPVSGAPISFTPPGTPIIGNTPSAGGFSNPFSFDRRDLSSVGRSTAEGMDSFRVIEPLANQNTGMKWAFGRTVSVFGQQFQLSALLEAAENANLAKTLAAPRVATVNNQPANINIVRKIPYQSTVVGAGGVQSVTYAYEDIGVQMTITPNITNNDYIRMKIQPQQRIFISQNGSARPTVDERISMTNVIVRDEDTAVVAGLRQQAFNETGDGIPWVQQIPVLGWLFKSKTYGNRKTDLMAFVTPHIIKQAQALSDKERTRYNEIDVQWDLPDYFFDEPKFDLNKK